jgi:hypothetical protein
MTRMLQDAFTEASKLPPAEQDALATFLLAELSSEEKWDRAFARAPGKLARLAEEALVEHRAGKSEVLDPEHL